MIERFKVQRTHRHHFDTVFELRDSRATLRWITSIGDERVQNDYPVHRLWEVPEARGVFHLEVLYRGEAYPVKYTNVVRLPSEVLEL